MTSVFTRVPTAIDELRRNYHTNPGLKVDLTFFSGNSVATVGRVTGGGVFGGPCGVVDFGGTGVAALYGPTIPVVAGQVWTLSTYVRSGGSTPATGRTTALRVIWSDNTNISSTTVNLTSDYVRLSVTVTVPAGVTTMQPGLLYTGTGVTGSRAVWSSWLVERTATLGDYFDGDTADSGPAELVEIYQWAGTSGLSESVYGTAASAARRLPLLTVGPFTAARPPRSITHQLLHSSATRKTYVPPAPARGRFELLAPTADAALDLVRWFTTEHAYMFYDTAAPDLAVTFDVHSEGGDVEYEQIKAGDGLLLAPATGEPTWVVRVPWIEATL